MHIFFPSEGTWSKWQWTSRSQLWILLWTATVTWWGFLGGFISILVEILNVRTLRHWRYLNVVSSEINVTVTTKFLTLLCFSYTVQWCPKRGHFTTQLDANQRREADKVLRNRPGGWNRNAHCLPISKTEIKVFFRDAEKNVLSDKSVVNSLLMIFFKCCWHFYAHIKSKQCNSKDMFTFCTPSLLQPLDPATSLRVSTSPETGTRACSGRFTGSQRVRMLLLLRVSHTTAPLSLPSIAKVIPQTD